MKIIYVHHGQRDVKGAPSHDDGLTMIGSQDCELVAKILESASFVGKIKAIYTSTFFRCKKTAEIINKRLNTKIVEDVRLNEFKSLENETWIECQKRVIECIDDIVKMHEADDVVVCVTSGVNLGAFICLAYGLEPTEKTPFLGVPSCSPIVFEV